MPNFNLKSGADTQSRTGDLTLTKGALYQLSHISTYLERAAGIEPASSAWKAEVIAIIRCPHPETRLPSSFCNTKETALFSIELISLPNQLRLRKASPESGGGGRIRTFEVDDGRFTVCSLWPLGNPTQIVMVPTTGIELVTY